MFAFFVVMFATAQTDKTKAREVAATAREALQHGQLTSTLEGIINQRRVVPEGKGDSRLILPSRPLQRRRKMLPWLRKRIPVKAADTLNRTLEKELEKGELLVQLIAEGW